MLRVNLPLLAFLEGATPRSLIISETWRATHLIKCKSGSIIVTVPGFVRLRYSHPSLKSAEDFSDEKSMASLS